MGRHGGGDLMPRWPLEADDTIALLGIALLASGAWAKWGPAEAAIVSGTLLLLAYTLRELIALRRPRG